LIYYLFTLAFYFSEKGGSREGDCLCPTYCIIDHTMASEKFRIPLPPALPSTTGASSAHEVDGPDDASEDGHIQSAVANASIRAGYFGTTSVDSVRDETSVFHSDAPPSDTPAPALEPSSSRDSKVASSSTVCAGYGLRSQSQGPIVCLVIGMAGSGKSTLLQRINAEAHLRDLPSYVINLDPAVAHVPYGTNIDIRGQSTTCGNGKNSLR
jgi:hypothetical protein